MRNLDLPVHKGLRALEPRLRSLLRLGENGLFELYINERRRLDANISRLDKAFQRLRSDEADRPSILAAIRTMTRSIVAPRTLGVYYPGDDVKAGFISAVVWADASAEDLARLGISVRSSAGTIFTTNVPLRLLWPLIEAAGSSSSGLAAALKYVELPRPWKSELLDAIPTAGIDVLHASTPPVTGGGVIVGIVDSGIDVYHPHFLDPGGATRIRFLWDQGLNLLPGGAGQLPAPGAGFGAAYGVEYSAADIDAELASTLSPPHQIVRSKDEVGHGTLVASCAASSGHIVNGSRSHIGAAPGASIVAVRLHGESRIFADSPSVLDGAAYVFARAAALGMPCVVNLSASDNMGAHDGTTLGEQFLDNLMLTPGRAFVCAAGNLNDSSAHIRGVVAPGGSNLTLVYHAVGPVQPTFSDSIQVWYDGPDRFTLQIAVPSSPPVTIGPVAAGANTSVTIPGTSITVEIWSDIGDPRNGDNVIDVVIGNPLDQALPVGAWIWTLAPAPGSPIISGAFAAWADRQGDFFREWVGAVADNGTISVPACGLRTIAVGGHVRNDPATIMFESGCGPTRDGRVKPELAASGQVNAARSRDMLNPPSGTVRPAAGTSCSAPIVAGAVALLFECHGPALTSSDIKQLLLDSARPTTSAASLNAFGFGTLDVSGACVKILSPVDLWIRDSVSDSGIEPYAGPEPPFSSPDIVILDAAGNPADNPRFDPVNFWNNLIDVTVRNRGAAVARNVDVFLYWADPATYIPFPSAWYTSGIYTGPPGFVEENNRIVIQRIPAGGSRTVRFAWAPPAPGTNLSSDAHFCLIARVEHEGDASNVGSGGWGVVAGSNNVAMHNVLIIDASAPPAPTGLRIVGTSDDDAVECWSEGLTGAIEIVLPTGVLPWRELGAAGTDPDLGDRLARDLDSGATARILAVTGATRAHVAGPLTTVYGRGEGHRMTFSHLRLREGASIPVRINVAGTRVQRDTAFVNVAQRSGGKIAGGVRLEIRRELAPAKLYDVRRQGNKVIVRPREVEDAGSAVARRVIQYGVRPWRRR